MDDLVMKAMVHFSRLHVNDDFVCVERADALYESLGMVVSAKKCGTAFEHEVWGGQLDGKRGKLGFGAGRRVSLMLATRGLSSHDLRRLLGLWVYTLSFRRRKRCPLRTWHSWPSNVSHHDAVTRRAACVYFSRPLLDADFRAQPHFHLFATDASSSGAGACSTPVSQELWTLLYDFCEDKRVLSEVVLGHELAAPARTSRLAGGGCRVGG